MMEVRGQGVLLTGGSSGIGRSLAIEAGRRGARLALVARRADRLKTVSDEVIAAGGSRPVTIVADLSRRGEAQRAASESLRALGTIDILINNAGGGVGGTQMRTADLVEGRDAFEVNFWSPAAFVGALLPPMVARRSGTVVNVTSMVQVMTWPMMGHYAASKAALGAATETLRLELHGSGVHVIEVIPGPVHTPIQGETALVPGIERALKSSPMGQPDQLAKRMVAAIERGRSRVIYPSPLAVAYAVPWVTRRYIARLARRSGGDFDIADTRVMRTGSAGAPEAQRARDDWERAQLPVAERTTASGSVR